MGLIMFLLKERILMASMFIFLQARILIGHKMILVRMKETTMDLMMIFLQPKILMAPMMISSK